MLKSFKSLCLCSLMIILTLSGCIEEYDAELPENETRLLVVEGRIHPGQCVFTLSRTESLNMSGAATLFEENAELSIVGSDGSRFRMDHWGDGVYLCNGLNLDPNVKYSLHIKDGNDTYESEPQYPLATEEIKNMVGIQNTPESNIDVLLTTEAPSNASKEKYYRWEVYETWEVRPEITTTIYFDTSMDKAIAKSHQFPERGWMDNVRHDILVGSGSNYEGQQIQNLKIYDINRDDERMYYGYSADVIQIAISKGEYEYELARRQAGYEMGGLFTPLPSSLPTNIRCTSSNKHVIGYVGCSLSTSAGRIFLNPNDYSIHRIKKANIVEFVLSMPATVERAYDMLFNDYYLVGWSVQMPGQIVTSRWAKWEYLDVRLQGAYIETPYFWPTGDYKSCYESIPCDYNFHSPYYYYYYYDDDYEDFIYE